MRIWFTSEDLARTRLAIGPSPLIETVLSAQRPCCAMNSAALFGPWREQTAGIRRGSMGDLLARPKALPDFVFETPHAGSLRDSLDLLAATPRADFEAVATWLARGSTPARTIRGLAEGDRETMRALAVDLAGYHDTAMARIWPRLLRRCREDLAWRAATVARSGVEGLLAGLHPRATWNHPVLTTDARCADDVHLGGAGLLLVPSLFAWPHLTIVYDVPQPMIVYPVRDIHGVVVPGAADGDPVAALLGRTRAAVLEAVAGEAGSSTTGLARQLGISVALAAHHLHVLHDAGLVLTTRAGRVTEHLLTPLGGRVLGATSSAGEGPAAPGRSPRRRSET